MDDDETERLISDLRGLLFRKGFGWVAVEAEEGLYPTVATRTRALALIAAAETITVDLAAVELAVDEAFDGQDVRFKPDELGRDEDGDTLAARHQRSVDFDVEALQGQRRRTALADLAARRQVFAVLRSRLDGLV
jgi:hypothetical protein